MTKTGFDLSHSVRVVWQIGWSDFLLKYRGSALGYVWSFADPLVRFLVILIVFQSFVDEQIEHYPLYLFLGIIGWDFFVRTVTGCLAMLNDKAAIIQKIPFPRILLIYAVGWTNAIIFCTHLIIYFVFAFLMGVAPHTSILLLPIFLILFLLFSLGIGMFLSSFALKFRDIPHLWQVLHQILFWLTPIFYPHSFTEQLSVPFHNFHFFIQYQPVSLFLFDLRQILLYHQIPSSLNIVFIAAVSLLLFFITRLVFLRRSRYFVQEY